MADKNGQPVVRELVFSSADGGTKDTINGKSVIWKDILREGEFAMTPGLTGTIAKPFRVVRDGVSSATERTISLSELDANFKDRAFEHVTVPTNHKDKMEDNTGFIDATRTIERDGKMYLQGAFRFTEPDIGGKVERGTIPNCSSGVLFDHVRKADGKKFNAALYHVCLTKNPWIPDLAPFEGIAASDDEIEGAPVVEAFQFAEGDSTGDGDETGRTAEVMWDERSGFNWVRSQVEEALRPDMSPLDDGRPQQEKPWYYVEDVSDKLALATEHFKGTMQRLLIPYSRTEDGSVELAPSVRWQNVKEAMIAASDHIADNFDSMTPEKIAERLTAHLSDEFGEKASSYEIEDVAVNNTVKIRNKTTKQEWVASFFDDGTITRIAPSSSWESTKAPEEPPKPAPVMRGVVMTDDSLEARRKRAAEQRRRMLTTTH